MRQLAEVHKLSPVTAPSPCRVVRKGREEVGSRSTQPPACESQKQNSPTPWPSAVGAGCGAWVPGLVPSRPLA